MRRLRSATPGLAQLRRAVINHETGITEVLTYSSAAICLLSTQPNRHPTYDTTTVGENTQEVGPEGTPLDELGFSVGPLATTASTP